MAISDGDQPMASASTSSGAASQCEGALASTRRGERNTVQIPAACIVDGENGPEVVPTLKGTLTLLRDAGFGDDAALEWLLEEADELGTSPLDALRSGQRAHVRRLAQALL